MDSCVIDDQLLGKEPAHSSLASQQRVDISIKLLMEGECHVSVNLMDFQNRHSTCQCVIQETKISHRF